MPRVRAKLETLPAVSSHIMVQIAPSLKQIDGDGYYEHLNGSFVVFLSTNHKPVTAIEDVSQICTPLTDESSLKCVAMADWRHVHPNMPAPPLKMGDDDITRKCLELILDCDLHLEGPNDQGWTEILVCDRSGVLCPSPVRAPIHTTTELLQQVTRFLSSKQCDDHIEVYIKPLSKLFLNNAGYEHVYGELHLSLTANPDTKHSDYVQNVRKPLSRTSNLKCIAIADWRHRQTPECIEQVNDDLLRRCLELILDARHDDVWSQGHDDAGWSVMCICDRKGVLAL